MADSRDGTDIHWIEPQMRGIFPLDGFHVSRSLAKQIVRHPYQITLNTAFNEVVTACAERDETWINHDIQLQYTTLHHLGHAHSLEVWDGDDLVGGVYGVTIGAAFFGESMFSRRTNGSKIALAYLVDRLKKTGFTLFDTQFITPHLASLGAIEVPKTEYKKLLNAAITQRAILDHPNYYVDHCAVAQRKTQTS